MEDNLKNTLFGLVLFVLFSAMILTFVVGIASNYGKDTTEINGALNLTLFEDSIKDINDTAEGYRERFDDGGVDDIDDPTGIFSIMTDAIELIVTPFELISQILYNVFGVPALFTGVLLGLLAISIILGIWRLLRAGS